MIILNVWLLESCYVILVIAGVGVLWGLLELGRIEFVFLGNTNKPPNFGWPKVRLCSKTFIFLWRASHRNFFLRCGESRVLCVRDDRSLWKLKNAKHSSWQVPLHRTPVTESLPASYQERDLHSVAYDVKRQVRLEMCCHYGQLHRSGGGSNLHAWAIAMAQRLSWWYLVASGKQYLPWRQRWCL